MDIAATNFTTLIADDKLGGLFADDRSLATWLSQQLDHDLTYLDAARARAAQVGTLTDQLVQRVSSAGRNGSTSA